MLGQAQLVLTQIGGSTRCPLAQDVEKSDDEINCVANIVDPVQQQRLGTLT